MQGDSMLTIALNSLLVQELSAVNQYIAHSDICASYGYGSLHEHFKKMAVDEIKHAEKLFLRMVSLGATPGVIRLDRAHTGREIAKQLVNDHALELRMIDAYNEATKLAETAKDFDTREILKQIVEEENMHVESLQKFMVHITLPDSQSQSNNKLSIRPSAYMTLIHGEPT